MKLPKLTKKIAEQIDAEYQDFLKKESLKESTEDKTEIDKYLNPRTRKVWNAKEVKWIERPVTWNVLIKLPSDRKDLMNMNYYDLTNDYSIDEVEIDLDGLWHITSSFGNMFQVTRGGEPWKKFINKNNETRPIEFKSLQDAYDFYLKNIDNKDIENKLQGE